MSDPYRHPAGRTCGGVIGMWTVLGAVLAMLGRKGRR